MRDPGKVPSSFTSPFTLVLITVASFEGRYEIFQSLGKEVESEVCLCFESWISESVYFLVLS